MPSPTLRRSQPQRDQRHVHRARHHPYLHALHQRPEPIHPGPAAGVSDAIEDEEAEPLGDEADPVAGDGIGVGEAVARSQGTGEGSGGGVEPGGEGPTHDVEVDGAPGGGLDPEPAPAGVAFGVGGSDQRRLWSAASSSSSPPPPCRGCSLPRWECTARARVAHDSPGGVSRITVTSATRSEHVTITIA